MPSTLNREQTASSQIISTRIQSVDVLRGLVMVIMALDHVREFWSPTAFRPEDISQTTVLLFFTRWITHFCAPTFVFLSGMSVFLYAQKKKNRKEVSVFLLTRGLWLVFLELTVINFLWQFLHFQFILIQVIWAIGWSMVALAGLIWLPRWIAAAISIVIIAGHNLLPVIQPVTASNAFWALLHNTPFFVQVGQVPVLVAYTILPWTGVMLAGYLLGSCLSFPVERRQRWFYSVGAGLLLVFFLLRFINGYGDPAPWSVQDRGGVYTVLSFFNVSKYPPSLLFVCLTLGVALLLLAALEGRAGRWSARLRTFGKVPFFFYLLHIPLISASAYLWTYLAFGQAINLSFSSPNEFPAAYHPDLLRAYLVWIGFILLLYFPCRWYGRYRQQHQHQYRWLSYL